MHVSFCITNFINTVFVCVYFCRFEFVKQLKRKIDEALSPLIEDEIEKFAMAGQVDTSGQETLVSKITQSVIHSKPYVISGLSTNTFLDKKSKLCVGKSI